MKRYKVQKSCYERSRREITELKMELKNLQCPLVFCHNDLLTGSLIYNERNG